MITYVETIKDVMYDVLIKPGQIIHATDTNETFFDTEEGNRIILDNVIYLNKESEKALIVRPLTNRVYIVRESSKAYKYEGTWFQIKDSNYLLCTIFHNDEYVPTTIMKGDKKIAPRTLASIVYNDLGEGVSAEIEEINKLTLCKTKAVYVEATENHQRVFRIPFPILDYDFRKNFMTVIIDGVIVDERNYTIRDDNYFVLNDDQTPLDSGQLVLFIFYYNVYIDINDGVVLQTKNLADRCVTEPKLANNAVSTRTIIAKNVTNIKLADNAVDSRVLAPNSVTTEHLNVSSLEINANNIVETNEKKFVSQTQINKWDNMVTDVQQLKNKPQLHVSDSEPTQNIKETDIWVDTRNFVFKVRKNGSWRAMGAVYN